MKMNRYLLGFHLLKHNLKSILLFELFYKLVLTALFAPVLIGVLNLAMYYEGVSYLSNENFIGFLVSPTTLLLLLIVFIVFAMIMIVEISAIVEAFHASYHKQKITLDQMFRVGFHSSVRIFHVKNLLIFVFVLTILPITNMTIISGYVSSISLPDFIMEAIAANHLLTFLLLSLLVLLSVVAFRWIFSIHFFVIEKIPFLESRKQSLLMNKKRYGKNVLHLVLWNVVVMVVVVVAAMIGIGAVTLVIKIFASSKIALSMSLATTAAVVIFLLTMFASLTVPITFAFLSAMYYQYKFERGIDITPYQPPLLRYARFKKVATIILIVACLIDVVYIDIVSDKNFSFGVQFLDKPRITAHRGDSVTAPENTLKAFESAIEHNADYIELDVQQTKDGVIVVMHDSNLKRTTGLNKNIWEVTYDEIKDLDAGSWFGAQFQGVKIPTLEETLEFCKGEIMLNIELKPTGHEVDFEKSVVDLVYEKEFEENCIIASMNYNSLKKVKEYAADIKTLFVTAVAYGELINLESADAFSVEAYFATSSLVNRLHDQGKEVYAWTVNSEESIQSMIDVGVDNIITDNPVLARELIYSKSLNENIVDFISGLLD